MNSDNSGSSNTKSLSLLFVVPRYVSPGVFYQYPIGLAMVYAFAKRAGVAVSVLNLCHEHCTTSEALKREFSNRRVDVVCTSGMSMHWQVIADVLLNSKKINHDIITVVGGPIITADPELAIMNLPIDYGVVGEGEYTLLELLEVIQERARVDTVKGLAFKGANGKVVLTGKRAEIKDLDSLAIQEYEDFRFGEATGNFKMANEFITLESWDNVRFAEMIGSRSCPFSCTFCYHPLGKIYRQRSLDHIFMEIDYLTNTFGINLIAFNDELFSVDHKRMLAFAERIKPYNIKFIASFRVNKIEREVMEQLHAAGLLLAGFGIESMNDIVLKSMKKKIKRAEIIKALETCRQIGLESTGNIILGDPAETYETAMDSIAWWFDNPHFNVSMGFIRAVPNAPFYQEALKRGLIHDRLSHVIELPLLNLSQMSDRQYFKLVMKVAWWNFHRTNKKEGIVLSTRKLDERVGNRHYYEVRAKCPFCKAEQTQKKYLRASTPFVVLVCTHCLTYFKISQNRAFPGEYSIFSMLGYLFLVLAHAFSFRFIAFGLFRHKVKATLRRIRNL